MPIAPIALQFLAHMRTGDWPALGSLLACDAQQHILPASLGIPARTRAELLARLPNFTSLTQTGTINLVPIDVIEGVDGRVVVHAKAQDTFSPDGLKEFANEFVFLFKFTAENGATKIAEYSEFVDSAFTQEYRAYIAAHPRS